MSCWGKATGTGIRQLQPSMTSPVIINLEHCETAYDIKLCEQEEPSSFPVKLLRLHNFGGTMFKESHKAWNFKQQRHHRHLHSKTWEARTLKRSRMILLPPSQTYESAARALIDSSHFECLLILSFLFLSCRYRKPQEIVWANYEIQKQWVNKICTSSNHLW